MVAQFTLGDVVHLKKQHPCGSFAWEVVRVGADIGLRCLTCSHRVLMERAYVERRMKGLVRKGPAPETSPDRSEGAPS